MIRWVSFALLLSLALHAELIPADRLYTAGWPLAGVSGGIPDTSGRTVYTTITSTGNTTDRLSTINTALANCPSGQVVVLGPGSFRVTGQININNETGVVLRGSGVGVTIIDSTHTGAWGFLIGNTAADYQQYSGTTLSADEAQGQTVLSMTSTTAYSVGSRVSIHRADSQTAAWPTISTDDTGRVNRSIEHRTKVTAKDSSTITIADPLPFDCTTAANTQVHVVADGFAYQCGVEYLTLDFNGDGAVYGISMWNADECWLKGVEIKDAANYLVYMLKAQHCTIHKCYLNGIGGTGNNGSGLLMEHSSMNLIENSVIRYCQPNIEMNFGCTGNVISYNWMLQSQGNISLDSNHGAHNCFNLFEGNVAPNLKPDGYFGSVSHDTALRNRFLGTDDIGGTHDIATIDLKRFTRSYNVVGNILGLASSGTYEQTASGATGAAIYQLGYPNIGNTTYSGTASPLGGDWWADWPDGELPAGFQERDLDVAATLIRKGNYNTINAAIPASEALGGDTIPNSYYLESKPAWFYGLTWPPFNPSSPVVDMTDSVEAIPAGYRYLNAGADPADGDPEPEPSTNRTASATSARVGTIQFR